VASKWPPRLFGPGPREEAEQEIMAICWRRTGPETQPQCEDGTKGRLPAGPESAHRSGMVCAGDHDSYSTSEITGSWPAGLPDPEVVDDGGVGHLPKRSGRTPSTSTSCGFLTRALPVAWTQVARV